MEIQKVVSDETDVCVFVKITAEGLSTESIHHFVVQDGLEVEFNIYDDSQRMAEAARYPSVFIMQVFLNKFFKTDWKERPTLWLHC